MPISLSVLPARDMDPIILVVGSLQNHLVEVGVVLDEVNQLAGSLRFFVSAKLPNENRPNSRTKIGQMGE